MHGEYTGSFRHPFHGIGSPPHAWGIHSAWSRFRWAPGITPTCMGNTTWHRFTTTPRWDHPHMHGEYIALKHEDPPRMGSPPHAWGILIFSFSLAFMIRITPTCMGNTWVRNHSETGVQDHPHMHGEYTKRSLLRRDPYILKSYFLMSFSASCIVAFASDKALCGCSFSIPYFASIVPR